MNISGKFDNSSAIATLKIAIIIPIYNGSLYLSNLFSIIASENLNDNTLIIFVDDGSTDSTYTSLINLSSTITNSYIIHLDTNFGQAASRNAGLSFAKSKNIDYVTFLDVDDSFDTGYLSGLTMSCLSGSDVIVSSFSSVVNGIRDQFNGRGYLLDDFSYANSSQMLTLLSLDRATVSPCNKLIRLSKCPYFPVGVKEEDTLWVFHLYSNPDLSITRCIGPSYIYQINSTSSTRKSDLRIFDSFWILQNVETLLSNSNISTNNFTKSWMNNVIAYRIIGLPKFLRYLWIPIWIPKITRSNVNFFSKIRIISKIFLK